MSKLSTKVLRASLTRSLMACGTEHTGHTKGGSAMSRPARASMIPNGSWPRRMPASLAAGYCGGSTVDASPKPVGKEYPLAKLDAPPAISDRRSRPDNDRCVLSFTIAGNSLHAPTGVLCHESKNDTTFTDRLSILVSGIVLILRWGGLALGYCAALAKSQNFSGKRGERCCGSL